MTSPALLAEINAQSRFVLLAAALFCFSQTNIAIAQQADSLNPDPSTQAVGTKSVDRTSGSRDSQTKANAWIPPDIDRSVPEVTPGVSCPLPSVLSAAGKRVEELARNVDKFTATEVVEHQSVDRSGRLDSPKSRKFNYLVTMARTRSGGVNVEEYRNGGSAPDQFPDNIATVGTPSLVLIFHPHHVNDFDMKCEGLGEWRGKPAWQVRFEELPTRRNSMVVVQIGTDSFSPRLRGRAWILADSYQVARLESDLVDQIPKIRLRLQHEEIEYRPVALPDTKAEIWLPSSAEMYMDFIGRRFYRRHSFTDLKFFTVKVQQTFGDPKE
jgi:hypothetical protein